MSDDIPLEFNGVPYVHNKVAAGHAGLSRDYIARLCKRGVLRGERLAGAWYVNIASVNEFLIHQAYRKEIWRAEVANQRRREMAELEQASRIKERAQIVAVDAAHAFAQSAGGGATYLISPALEFLHKLAALTLALTLVVSAYALVNPAFRTFTLASLPETAAAAAATPAVLQRAFQNLAHDVSFLAHRAEVNIFIVPSTETLPQL